MSCKDSEEKNEGGVQQQRQAGPCVAGWAYVVRRIKSFLSRAWWRAETQNNTHSSTGSSRFFLAHIAYHRQGVSTGYKACFQRRDLGLSRRDGKGAPLERSLAFRVGTEHHPSLVQTRVLLDITQEKRKHAHTRAHTHAHGGCTLAARQGAETQGCATVGYVGL